jgi:hypothetical protein
MLEGRTGKVPCNTCTHCLSCDLTVCSRAVLCCCKPSLCTCACVLLLLLIRPGGV